MRTPRRTLPDPPRLLDGRDAPAAVLREYLQRTQPVERWPGPGFPLERPVTSSRSRWRWPARAVAGGLLATCLGLWLVVTGGAAGHRDGGGAAGGAAGAAGTPGAGGGRGSSGAIHGWRTRTG